MGESNKSYDGTLDYLLNINADGKTNEEKEKLFDDIAAALNFTKKCIASSETRSENVCIKNLKFKDEGSVAGTPIGVYFIYFLGDINKEEEEEEEEGLTKDSWSKFRGKRKISPWRSDKIKPCKNDILYIGERCENLYGRLKVHTISVGDGTQALRLYEKKCPHFKYKINCYYKIANTKDKTENKILCLILEIVAKKLFPTLIGV